MADLINTDPFLLFFGTFFLVMGLSIFFAADAWKEYTKMLGENKALLLIGGVINLPVGLFIVMFYNSWDGLASSLLMIVGIISLLKAIALLTKPEQIQKLLRDGKLTLKPFWLQGLPALVIGAGLLVL